MDFLAAKIQAVHSMLWQFKRPLGEGYPDFEDESMIKGVVVEIDSKLLNDVYSIVPFFKILT